VTALAAPGDSMQGKVVVITGATGGLGRAIAGAFAALGAHVAAGYHRDAAGAHALADELGAQYGTSHLAIALPVTDSQALARAAAAVGAKWGRADVLVNCAGTTRFVPHHDLDALDDALIDQVLQTNVRGPIAAVRAFRALLAQHRGLVVNISSVAAQTAVGSNIAYCASKAALDNLTRSMARALAPQIRVLSVAPGLVDTDFVKGLDEAWRDAQARATPLRRLASAQDVARAVTAAATSLTFCTGTTLLVDGGRAIA
jgi:3-oxoacyl-[acyl-carrier protein] reductase